MPCSRGRIALRTRSGICDKTVRGIHQEMDKDLHSRTIAALGEDVVRAIQSSSVSPAAALPRPPPPPALRCPLASPPASGP